jgi:hypothetical protein|eukprot:SAG25_NODE_3319_length_1130_cov_2.655674_1_plen_67_part_00
MWLMAARRVLDDAERCSEGRYRCAGRPGRADELRRRSPALSHLSRRKSQSDGRRDDVEVEHRDESC